MKKIIVLTGAGMSAESGIQTFRGAGGLWEGHDVMEVASPEGFARDPELVLRFYNERRRQLRGVQPNAGHRALVRLEDKYQVQIITQNVDDLHERAGSMDVMHLHGELIMAQSATNPNYVIEVEGDIHLGDLAPDGGQMRPNVVWFGEAVPMFEQATSHMPSADILIIIGTSLVVYPANTLMEYCLPATPVYVVDPARPEVFGKSDIEFIEEGAATGVPKLVDRLLAELS